MTAKKGSLSINSENIFPIIKKWMYSDHDIFVREVISNGCDAITKLKKLDVIGEYALDDDYKPKITVSVSPKEKTLTFTDNGLGMTEAEVEEYINQIAFSGASDFLEKYQGKTDDEQIIGHFGLGFYSVFMVADEVHIDTLSFHAGATPVHWECDGGTEYSMETGHKDTVGTTITLFLNEDCLEFANEYRMREVIEKYCSFMPVEIYLENADAEAAYETIDAKDVLDTDTVIETLEDDKLKIAKRPKVLNDPEPLWTKHPNDVTEEEYKEFYRNVFRDYKEPLFWIHLNMDYPFNLKGILYFPKINTEFESAEGVIKLYNNQVFVADNIKEVIPEFLMLLKGVIDCPDLPLNVSRSALQNDGFVKKISEYITKKVADKLSGLCKTEKENYEKYWEDISPFIKYGCLRDEKFCDKMNDYILFKDLDDNYVTLPELLAPNEEDAAETDADADTAAASDSAKDVDTADASEEDKEPEDTRAIVYYVTDRQQQGQYIQMFKDNGLSAVYLTHDIDTPFISQLERRNENYRFLRIDADVNEAMKDVAAASEEDLAKTAEQLETGEDLPGSSGQRKSRRQGSLLKRQRDFLPHHAFRGQPPHDGYDACLLRLRHGSRHVWRG